MRTVRAVLASIWVLASTTSQCQDTATEDKGKNLEQRIWPAVSNGLVFVGGEFIPPPYVVSRVKNVIYINGKHVGTPGGWPTVKIQEPVNPDASKPVDPKIPSGITEKTTIYDKEFIKYNTEKKNIYLLLMGRRRGST